MKTATENQESEAVKEYKRLLVKLMETKNKHNGKRSFEENEIIRNLDVIWYNLTESECKETDRFYSELKRKKTNHQ
jgi:hypothetical protein